MTDETKDRCEVPPAACEGFVGKGPCDRCAAPAPRAETHASAPQEAYTCVCGHNQVRHRTRDGRYAGVGGCLDCPCTHYKHKPVVTAPAHASTEGATRDPDYRVKKGFRIGVEAAARGVENATIGVRGWSRPIVAAEIRALAAPASPQEAQGAVGAASLDARVIARADHLLRPLTDVEKWYRGPCPGGVGHETDEDHVSMRGDCHGCITAALRASEAEVERLRGQITHLDQVARAALADWEGQYEDVSVELARLREQIEEVRPEVLAFARVMSAKLDGHNGDRGEHGWRTATPDVLLGWLSGYVLALRDALAEDPRAPTRVTSKAANVANLAMMISDVYGALLGGEEGGR